MLYGLSGPSHYPGFAWSDITCWSLDVVAPRHPLFHRREGKHERAFK